MNDAILVKGNYSRVEKLFEKLPDQFASHVSKLAKSYSLDLPAWYGRLIPNESFVATPLPGWSAYWLSQSGSDSYQALRFDIGRLQLFYYQSYDNDNRDRAIQYLNRLHHAMNDMLFERRQALKFLRISPLTTLINTRSGVNTYIFQSEYDILLA